MLACAEGDRTHAEIAAELGCNPVTVGKWRHRFAADRLDGLVDAPRPGAARTIGDDVIEAIVVETLETAPPDATHWSTRGLAANHGISHTTVREIWRAFGLKPWRQDSFKVSPDPDLVEKIRDLVALYMNPPVAARVRRRREAADPSAQPDRPTLPMLPTTPARATHDYTQRHCGVRRTPGDSHRDGRTPWRDRPRTQCRAHPAVGCPYQHRPSTPIPPADPRRTRWAATQRHAVSVYAHRRIARSDKRAHGGRHDHRSAHLVAGRRR